MERTVFGLYALFVTAKHEGEWISRAGTNIKSISKLLFKIKLDWYNESDAYSIGMKNAVTNDNGSLLKRRKEMRGW